MLYNVMDVPFYFFITLSTIFTITANTHRSLQEHLPFYALKTNQINYRFYVPLLYQPLIGSKTLHDVYF